MPNRLLSSFPKNWTVNKSDKTDENTGPADRLGTSRLLATSVPPSWRKQSSFDTASIAPSQRSDLSRLTAESPSVFSQTPDNASQRSFGTQVTTPSREGTPASQRSHLPTYKPEWTLAATPQSPSGRPATTAARDLNQNSNSAVLTKTGQPTVLTARPAGELPEAVKANARDSSQQSSSSASDPQMANIRAQVAGNIPSYGSIMDPSSSSQASASTSDPRLFAGDISGYNVLVVQDGSSSSAVDNDLWPAGGIPREVIIENGGSTSSTNAYVVPALQSISAGQLPPDLILEYEGSRDSNF